MAASQSHTMLGKVKQYFDDAAHSMYLTDTNGKILYVNNAQAKKASYQPAQIIGTKAGVLWGGRMSKPFYGDLWKTVKTDKKPWAQQITNHYRNGIADEYAYITPIVNQKKNQAAYFLQLGRKDEGGTGGFAEEFLEICTPEQPAVENALIQMLSWLTPVLPATNLVREAIKHIAHNQESLEAALYTIFIEPTNESLTDRHADHQLITDAQQDPIAYQELYKKYLSVVRHYFVRRVGATAQAHDLTQDAFMRAFMYLDSYKLANASYKTYMLRIAHNLLVNHYKRQALRETQNIDDHDVVSLETSYSGRFDNQLLWKRTTELPRIQQTVLVMKYKDELSVREIATILGKSENAIKLHLSRARKALKIILKLN